MNIVSFTTFGKQEQNHEFFSNIVLIYKDIKLYVRMNLFFQKKKPKIVFLN